MKIKLTQKDVRDVLDKWLTIDCGETIDGKLKRFSHNAHTDSYSISIDGVIVRSESGACMGHYGVKNMCKVYNSL